MDYTFMRKHTAQDEKELKKMERALQTLSKKGLLTKLEYRRIATIRHLAARKILLYNIITSGYQEDQTNMHEMLNILTEESGMKKHANQRTELHEVNQESSANPLSASGKNPLLIDTIIHNVFQFLPLKEIKKCRQVNNQWNATAEPFLRKRGVIHFTPDTLKPSAFIHYSNDSLPDLPFTHFKFSNKCISGSKTWHSPEIQEFFDSWGHNIKSAEFSLVYLKPERGMENGKVNGWLKKAKNMTKLIINCDRPNPPKLFYRNPTTLRVDLDKLRRADSISLRNCDIMIPDNGINRRITPREITLKCVTFQLKGNLSNEICLDYIDFRQALKIDIRNAVRGMSFDMAKLVLNANSVHFDGVTVKNWGKARGKVNSIFLSNSRLIKRNTLKVKELTLESGTIDMAVISPAIEKLSILNRAEIICDYSLQLPHLQFLRLYRLSHNNLNVISRFSCCTNLVWVELVGCASQPALSAGLGIIPRSVKKLKIGDVKLIDDGHKLHLDILIQEGYNFETSFEDVTEMISNKTLKVNVLVLSCERSVESATSDRIIRFVKANLKKKKRLLKLVIGVISERMKLSRGRDLSRYADKESNYYLFTDTVSEAITREEFLAYANIDGQEEEED